MKKDVVILHAGDTGKSSHVIGRRPFTWLYLGQDIEQREYISGVLGKENRYLIGNLLQEVSRQQKQPFLDYIAELGLRQKNKRYWWASNTAYKNPLVSDFFLLWCYAAIFKKICSEESGSGEKSLVLFIQDRWLYRYLWNRYKENGSNFSFLSRKSVIPELLKSIVRSIAIRAYSLLRVVWQIRPTKSTTSKNNRGGEIYIYSWIRDRFFQDSEFKDAYFGRLPQFLRSSGLNVVYIAPLFLSPNLRSKCLNQGEFKFVFLYRYISLWSLVRSFFSIFTISSLSNSPFKILLLREIAYESASFPVNVLEYFAFKKLLKEMVQKKIAVIFPFENQPRDKMLCLAARDSGKNIKLIGYQHTTVPLILLNYFLGAGESSHMPLPQVVVTNSEYTLNLLKNAGYGETEFVNGGALRYEYLNEITKRSVRQDERSKTILVAMTYSRNLTEELLIVLFNTFKDLPEEEIKFVFKFHPEVPLERIRVKLPLWPAHFQKTDRPLPEILDEVDLVIYSSSTVGMEALLNGTPVVRYCSEHFIDLDPLDAYDEGAVKSCSGDNLKQVVMSALNDKNDHLAGHSTSDTSSLKKLFSQVDEEVWRQIVKL